MSGSECSGKQRLCGCGLRYRLRRLRPGQSCRKLERVRKLVESEAVVVCSGARRRARPGVGRLAAGVRQSASSGRSLTIRGAAGTEGNSGHDPMHVGSTDGVGVVDNECAAQRRRPGQRWRRVGSLAGVLHGDRRAVGERGTRNRQRPGGRRLWHRPTNRRHFRGQRPRHPRVTMTTAAGQHQQKRQARDGRCDSVKCATRRFHTRQCH